MNAMTILRRYRAAKDDIRKLQQRIDQRRDVLTSLGSLQADPNGGSKGTTDPDRNGRILAEIDELERQIEARREAEKVEANAVPALLDMVPELEGRVLFLYYVKRIDTGAIARKEKYTAGYVRKTKRNAEQLLEMLSPDRVATTLPAWYLREKGGDDE